MRRRAFLGFLARAPVVGAIAGKAAMEAAAGNLAGISVQGLGAQINAPSSSAPSSDHGHLRWRAALRSSALRREVEETLYEEQRHVGFIDPDIACLRSFSLNAKIAYQRQRNVERRIDQLQNVWPWMKIEGIARKLAERTLGL